MKKILSNWALLLVIAITAAPALAGTTADNSMPHGKMMQQMMQNRQMGNARHGSSGMMANKGMMGKGMMPMMMNGCRMNPMMMEGGMMSMMGGEGMMGRGMTPMMGNPSQMANYFKNYKKFQKFFNETHNLRKKLNDLQFEYGEARWNPNTTLGELQRMRARLNKLRQKIYAKRPQ